MLTKEKRKKYRPTWNSSSATKLRIVLQSIFAKVCLAILFLGFGACFSEISAEETFRIAYGSCLDQRKPMSLWETIRSKSPHAWVWLGDSIYLDTNDPKEKIPEFKRQKEHPSFQILKKKTKIWGTWDDHDFGTNDVGGEYSAKKESQSIFLDFLEEPPESPRRSQEGVYTSYNQALGELKVKVVLLDTRYHRSPLRRSLLWPIGYKSYIPEWEEEATFLGKAQWEWLEKELKEPSDLVLVFSSIQVLNQTHRWEKWGNFPLEREKLLELLWKYKNGKAILFSGDRHIAEVFQETKEGKFPIFDFTSSSLNKPLALRALHEETPERISGVYANPNFGLIEIKKKNKELHWKVQIISETETLFEKESQ